MKDTEDVVLSSFDFDYETTSMSVFLTEVTEKSGIGDVLNPYAFEYYSGTPSTSVFDKWGHNLSTLKKARTLNKIIYSEGKVTTLTFEDHDSGSPYSQGGLRIKEIQTIDPAIPDSVQITQYKYAQPELVYDPAVSDIFKIEYGSCDIKILPIQTSTLLSRAGSPVLYKEVSVLHGNLGKYGKTVYKYDQYLGQGLPDTVIHYRAEGSGNPTFEKVSEVFNTYTKDLDFREYVTTLSTYRRVFDVTPVVSAHYDERTGSRDVSERIYLSKAITRTYDLNDETRYRDETEEYFYESDDHIQLTKLKRTDSEGVVYETKYTYPLDYTISPSTTVEWEKAILTMQNKNIVTPIITQKTLRSNQVLGATKTDFKWWNQSETNANLKRVYPEILYSTELASPIAESTFNSGNYYEVDARILSYDEYGHGIESAKEGDYTSTIVYGHDNSLPVAQVMNASSNEIFYTSFEESGVGVFDSKAKTGRFSKSLSGSYTVPQPSGNFPSGAYQLTYWWKRTISGSWRLQKMT